MDPYNLVKTATELFLMSECGVAKVGEDDEPFINPEEETERMGRAVTAALRDHMHALHSMAIRPSPLAGLVDVSRVSDADLLGYLSTVGMGEAMPMLRLGSHRLLVPAPGGPPLPPGSRVIPPTYRIRSEHQVGFLLLWGMTF